MAVTVGIRELRNNLRAYLGRVKDGEKVVVTERGKPIARISSASEQRLLEEMAAAGLITRPKRSKTRIDSQRLTPVRGSVSDLVIDQRRESP